MRLDDDDERLLDQLAAELGDRSTAIREALRFLAADRSRREALSSFLADWEDEAEPVDEDAVSVMAQRYGL